MSDEPADGMDRTCTECGGLVVIPTSYEPQVCLDCLCKDLARASGRPWPDAVSEDEHLRQSRGGRGPEIRDMGTDADHEAEQ